MDLATPDSVPTFKAKFKAALPALPSVLQRLCRGMVTKGPGVAADLYK